MRAILLVHRYLAVAIGFLMLLWCVSGFVMMYQSYPSLLPEQRRAGLEPLEFSLCCDLALLDADAAAAAPPFRVEMLLGDPVVRFAAPIDGGSAPFSVLNLRTGQPLAELRAEQVLDVARRYGGGNGIAGEPRSLGIIEVDQWTIQTARRNRPVHHIAFDDGAGTEIYLSGASGEVFQATNRRVRVLSWFGAIPHWLYPTLLRQNGALWTGVVIWTSIAGTFLALTGLFVGISRLRRDPEGQLGSPFRGWWYWHHVSGLLFGVLALTWVFSGLMTMNPWGALAGGGTRDHRGELVGTPDWSEVRHFLSSMPVAVASGTFSQLQSAPFNHRLHVLATDVSGETVRLDVEAGLAQLTDSEVQSALARLSAPVRGFDVLTAEDSYYYGHKQDVSLPVYRVLLDDSEQTRIYIDHASGAVRSIGSSARWSRWVLGGLHSLDFAGLRVRPVWDLVVALLLAGVTALCAIGTWLALKRVRMDYRVWRGKKRRQREDRIHAGANVLHE